MAAQGSSSADPATVFAALAEIIYAPQDLHHVYEALCEAAPQLVSGCDHASLMIMSNGRFVTAGANDEVARSIDKTQRELGEGACVDAIVDSTAQVDSDLTVGSEWPRLADWVLENTPVRGMAGFRLLVDGDKVGALNIFSDTPGALSGRAVDQAVVLAAFASVSLMAAVHNQTVSQLRVGLQSNREIGKAVGLLMAFHKVSDDEAFEMLRKTSRDMNIRLAEVARQIVDYHRSR